MCPFISFPPASFQTVVGNFVILGTELSARPATTAATRFKPLAAMGTCLYFRAARYGLAELQPKGIKQRARVKFPSVCLCDRVPDNSNVHRATRPNGNWPNIIGV
jgi:hypothetical protein